MPRTNSLDLLDSRIALRTYAALVGLGGVTLAALTMTSLGPNLAARQLSSAVQLQLGGAVMVAAALGAYGLGSADVLTRRRVLPWFIAGHVVIWLMMEVQFLTMAGGEHLPKQASWVMLIAIVGLLYVVVPSDPVPRRAPLSVLNDPGPDTSAARGGLYEQQIREAAAQEERNRLARDLHDAVKQQIFAIQTSAATAEARLASDAVGSRAALAQVRQSAREAMSEMEALLSQLRVAPLGNTGLVEAIRKHAEALAFRSGANVAVDVAPWPSEDALPPGAHEAIFRIVQEALANVGRHARARHVRVSLDATPLRVEVRVQDDGTGFDQRDVSSGMGLHNMRARAAEIGGSIEVSRAEGVGTLVTLSVPFETEDARQYGRKQARNLAAAFGVVDLLFLLNLYTTGYEAGNAFSAGLFAILGIGQLRTWLRLRAGARAAATSMERVS